MSEICTRGHDGEDCANGEISGVSLTGRVYEPRSVRPLLTSAPVSVAAVDKLGSVDTTTATTQASSPSPIRTGDPQEGLSQKSAKPRVTNDGNHSVCVGAPPRVDCRRVWRL
jgi:hypothetical protein